MKLIVLFLALAILSAALPDQRPIIGIFTQSDESDEPVSGATKDNNLKGSNYTYIAASYVKYLQMSGAQVIPIYAYSSQSYFDQILPKINGILFPGGDVDIDITNTWTKNADYILKFAMAEKKKGNAFPIWGTCLGMQLLAYLTANYDARAISPVRGEVAVRNTIQIRADSTLLGDLPTDLKHMLQNGQGILYYNHHYAVTLPYYNTSPSLKQFWRIAATTTTSYSEDFLAVFESFDYPFYGVQFHPEKNLFEWKVPADRSESGAQIVQILSNKFVEEARKNKNAFANFEEFKALSIYNFKTQPTKMSFIQIYVFNEVNQVEEKVVSYLVSEK
jgi:gamma-glutamyl-gamma-aminobutyrate hydrolase PuuD